MLTGLAAASVIAVGLGLGVAWPAGADVICESDACDGNVWQRARGDDNSASFWGMSPGHNCTNYVAFKLTQAGIARPATHPGNAATWAERALADGYRVDHVPEVGAVAQWDAGASGYSSDGHVAYVEKVEDDGTIVVSEDFWFGGSQTGELTYRVVDPATVSNFIHYSDSTGSFLRLVGVTAGMWTTEATGRGPDVAALAALQLGDRQFAYTIEAGALTEYSRDPAGAWTAADTGVRLDGHQIAAVDMGKSRPYVMAVDRGWLVMVVRTGSTWQYMPTGVRVDGDITAVNIGGLWPTVYAAEGGVLQEIWGDPMGWHKSSTSMPASEGLSAAANSLLWPEVFSVVDGTIHRSWADELGWQSEDLGIVADGAISATRVADSVQVVFGRDHLLSVGVPDASAPAWTIVSTGLRAGTRIAALDGPGGPRVFQLG